MKHFQPCKGAPLLFLFLTLLAITGVHGASYYVDTAAQFNSLTDKFGASFSTLHPGDRVLLKGGTNWGGLIATLTGSMTDAEAQSNPAIVYACDASYNPSVGGVTVAGLCQIDLAGSGIVFAGVVFGSTSGMNKQGLYADYSGNDTAAYMIELDPLSRYMTVSHVKFDYCGRDNTDVNNDHYGAWIFLNGYHHTIQYCEFQGRDFNPNDINQPNPALRTSIRDATVVIYKGTADTVDWGYHSVRYNYFGQRLIPLSSDSRLYTPGDGTTATDLSNGWETIRNGNSSFVSTDFNNTIEYNVFYHALYAVDGGLSDNSGEPECISNKSRKNTYRHNTFLNNYGQLSLRQGDYCVVQGNYFLAGGAYDANGSIVFNEPLNDRMGGVRVFGFGHTVANNYFYNIRGNGGLHSAIMLGSGSTPTGTLASLNNGDAAAGYEPANYTQVLGNTFVDCDTLTMDSVNGQAYPVYGTQFFNNLVHFSSNIGAAGITADVPDALSNHGGQAQGNYVYSATASQLGSASAILGAIGNTITTTANPLMTDTYNVLSIPTANSPVVGAAAALPTINDTSATGASYSLAGNATTYAGLDVRGLARPASGRDIGDYQRGASGTPVRPLLRSEVGLVAATLPSYPVIAESFPSNTRTTQNPPASLTWFCSTANGTNTSLANGGMTLTSNNATRQAVAYFPTQSLNVGEVLTLSFSFSVTAPLNTSKGLRAGLLYSGATRITSDANANPTGYTGAGYGTFLNPVPPAAATPAVLVKRGGTGTIVTTPVGSTWAAQAFGGAVQSLVAGTTYAATLTIRRTGASQVTTTTTYSGGALTPVSVTATDSTSVITAFDTLALGVGNNTVGSIKYSGITLTKSTPLTASSGSAGGVVNNAIDFNLKSLVTSTAGPFAPLTFAVSSPLNGSVVLLSDGVTARFMPNSNYTGAASFAYSVSDGTAAAAASVALNVGSKLPATVTLGSLAQTYDGSAKAATFSTNPSGLAVDLTYDDGTGPTTTPPTNAGSYAVTGIINNATYAGLATGTLVISKAAATVTLGNLAQNFDGGAKTPSVSTTPTGLSVSVIYDDGSGSGPTSTPPSAIGSYAVVTTVNDANYAGSASGTFVISPTAASVIFPSGLLYAFDGTPKAVTPTTIPAGLAVSVTYNGSATAPSAIGSYTVVGTIADPNFSGTASTTLVITDVAAAFSTAGATIWVCPSNVASVQIECWGGGGAGGSAQRTGGAGSVQYGGGGAGGAYIRTNTFAVVPGATYYLNVGAGGVNNSSVTGIAVSGGDSWFNVTNIAPATTIAKGGAGGASAIGNTNTTRFGVGGVGTSTGSAGDVSLAGGGGAAASANAGGTGLAAGGGGGSSAGTSSVGATATTSAGATAPAGGGNGGAGNASGSASGTAGSASGGGGGGARDSSGATIAGGAGGAGKVVITVNKFAATVALGNLQQTFDGTPKSVTATTTPANLSIAITYNGSSTAPTAAGSYAVIATVTDANYSGSGSGTLVIAAPVTSWRQLYFGTTANTGTAADSADPDGDDLTNQQEYIFGANPKSANTGALLTASASGANIMLTFTAQQAAGTGYAGLTRHYAIESTTDLANTSSWAPIAGYTDIIGGNQTVIATLPLSGAKDFFRLKAWLQ